jgi:hypothetical protein
MVQHAAGCFSFLLASSSAGAACDSRRACTRTSKHWSELCSECLLSHWMQKRLAILVALLLGNARRGLGVLGGPLGHRAASRTATCALQDKSRRVSAATLHCSKVRTLTHFYGRSTRPSDRRTYSTTDFAGCVYPRNTPGFLLRFFNPGLVYDQTENSSIQGGSGVLALFLESPDTKNSTRYRVGFFNNHYSKRKLSGSLSANLKKRFHGLSRRPRQVSLLHLSLLRADV